MKWQCSSILMSNTCLKRQRNVQHQNYDFLDFNVYPPILNELIKANMQMFYFFSLLRILIKQTYRIFCLFVDYKHYKNKFYFKWWIVWRRVFHYFICIYIYQAWFLYFSRKLIVYSQLCRNWQDWNYYFF